MLLTGPPRTAEPPPAIYLRYIPGKLLPLLLWKTSTPRFGNLWSQGRLCSPPTPSGSSVSAAPTANLSLIRSALAFWLGYLSDRVPVVQVTHRVFRAEVSRQSIANFILLLGDLQHGSNRFSFHDTAAAAHRAAGPSDAPRPLQDAPRPFKEPLHLCSQAAEHHGPSRPGLRRLAFHGTQPGDWPAGPSKISLNRGTAKITGFGRDTV